MNMQDLNKAADLVKALEQGLDTQKTILEGLVTSLEAYQEFLAEQIVESQRESERLLRPTSEELEHV